MVPNFAYDDKFKNCQRSFPSRFDLEHVSLNTTLEHYQWKNKLSQLSQFEALSSNEGVLESLIDAFRGVHTWFIFRWDESRFVI